MALDISQIIAEFEARYQNQGQTARDIRRELFQPSVTETFFRTIPWNQDYYRSAYANIDSVLQAFSVPFVKKGTTKFKGHEQKLGEFKIDTDVRPDDLRHSWLGFLVEIAQADRSKWPIIRWIISQMIIPRSHKDMEEETAYWGWQKTGYSPTPTVNGSTFVREFVDEDTPTPPNAAMDGIRTQIIKMVAGGRANVINTGALTADPVLFVEQVEEFVLTIPRTHRSQMDYLFMSEVLKNRYIDGRRAKYNMQYAQVQDLLAIEKVMTKVQALPSQDFSNKIWTTMPLNRVKPTHVDNTGRFDIQKNHRVVELMTDWKKVLTFDVPEFIYTNDLEDAITNGDITARYSGS